jgi:hypothetical protein
MALNLSSRLSQLVQEWPLGEAKRLIDGAHRSHLAGLIAKQIGQDEQVIDQHIREGRFQRSLSLVAGLSGLLAGVEVSYYHYRGSYSQRIMYTPVIISPLLAAAGVAGAINARAARTVLPAVSVLTIADGVIGFVFHIRGIHRKPGGWNLPVYNIVMGPPVVAPLLFGIGGYLGLLASLLRREDAPETPDPLKGLDHLQPDWLKSILPASLRRGGLAVEQHVREGAFQKQLAVAMALSGFASGFEALYSHYKNNFNYRVQWTPIVLTPILVFTGFGTLRSRWIARVLLPSVGALAMLDGTVGVFFHVRGLTRRAGGLRYPLHQLMYGPPVVAPLLFSASGFLGVLASLLRRSD